MQIECRKEDSVFVIKPLQRTVDSSFAPEFQQHLAQAVQDGNDRIVLDTVRVSVIDSSVLGVILSTLKSLGGDGEIAISSRQESVDQLFKVTRMDKLLQVFPTTGEAAEALESRS